MFYHIREHMGVYHDENGNVLGYTEGRAFAELFYCFWCFSMLFGLPWGLLWATWPSEMAILSLPFALSALAIIIKEWIVQDN